MNTSFARFVAYAAGIGSVAEEGIALERDPLATIFVTMRCQPLLLSCAAPNRFEDREVRDGEVDALLLGERKWRQWAKQPIFIYCVQFSHRVLIVVRKASCRGESTCMSIATHNRRPCRRRRIQTQTPRPVRSRQPSLGTNRRSDICRHPSRVRYEGIQDSKNVSRYSRGSKFRRVGRPSPRVLFQDVKVAANLGHIFNQDEPTYARPAMVRPE